MRSRMLSIAFVAVALTASGSALAQSKETKAASGPRKDPENKTGISPYMELVVKGEKQFTGGDASSAMGTFQDAIKLDGDKMLAFYRLGEAQVAAGKLDDADATFTTALGKKGVDDLHAKIFFIVADLRERQHKWQAAKDAWGAYAAFLQNNAKAHGYPATAVDRQKMADRRMNDEVVYGKVKDRIAARKVEVEKEATENMKNDKLNR